MVEIGEVIKTEKGNATVSFERKTACDNCGMCAFNKDDMKVKLILKNDVNAKVGDVVEVSMGDRFVLMSAVIVYLIPLVLVGLGILIGTLCKLEYYLQIILAAVGFVLGFVISAFIDKKLKKKKKYSPTITSIIVNNDTSSEGEKKEEEGKNE